MKLKDQKKLNNLNIQIINKLVDNLEILIKDLEEFQLLEKKFMSLVKETKESRGLFRAIEKKFKEKKEEMSKFKICPACGRPL